MTWHSTRSRKKKKKDLMISCGEIISCSLISNFLEINDMLSEPLTGNQAGIVTTNTFSNSEIISLDWAGGCQVMSGDIDTTITTSLPSFLHLITWVNSA